MEPGELRIGNYVYANGKVAEVIAIASKEKDDIEVRMPDNTIVSIHENNIMLTPIPLSQETVHFCCRFNKYGVLKIDIHPSLHALKIVENHIVVLDDKAIPTMHFWDVNTLHKLQNLYFALKEQELKIDVPLAQ